MTGDSGVDSSAAVSVSDAGYIISSETKVHGLCIKDLVQWQVHMQAKVYTRLMGEIMSWH